jgi:mannose-6-phosphate isomerase-like protein (cupin superfamily)
MNITRRSALSLLPLLGSIPAWSSASDSLTTTVRTFEDLHAEKEDKAAFRAILEGRTHTGDYLEVHETVLEPGGAPHPAHHHVGEEMFLISSGTIEITVNGKATRLGPGSAAFVASNEEHGLRNAGNSPAQYFVVTLGSKAE